MANRAWEVRGNYWWRLESYLLWLDGVLRGRACMQILCVCLVCIVLLTMRTWYSVHNQKMGSLHLPIPECRIEPQCIREYVTTCARVSDPPPLFEWNVNFMTMFGMYQTTQPLPKTREAMFQFISFVIIPRNDDMEGVYAIKDTWGNPKEGLSVTYYLSEHPEIGMAAYMMPSQGQVQVIPDAGLSAGIKMSERNASAWYRGPYSRPEVQKLHDMANRDYLQWEYRCIKAIIYAFVVPETQHDWYFVSRDTVMPFPNQIARTVHVVHPDTPVIISYLQSSYDMPVQELYIAGPALAQLYRAEGGLTYGALEIGMIISRGAMKLLSENLGREPCTFLASADLTISRCAWRIGIYMAHHEKMRPFLSPGDEPGDTQSDPAVAKDAVLCSDTMSVHYMDMAYRSRWVECDLINKYYAR